MVGKRSYEDGCAAAHALDLIGERWALLVARELILGPKRFTDLRAGLPGISPNVLTQRLEELERASILQRRKLPPPASVWVYELTEWGAQLEGVIMALGRWGAKSPNLPKGDPLSVDSTMLSLRTMFDPVSSAGVKGVLEFRFGEERFRGRIGAGRLELVRGSADAPDVVVATSPALLLALIYGGYPIKDALRAGELTLSGDQALFKRFITLFPLPAPAPATYVPADGH
ncbi:winged helix-turn-helix transcriptional regulator [Tahibacter amnicola]|uniref:Winged helix-turn-helix transcriptional regulator n=1 Tax=Tahibacter amnicola TaxID=2976241 RepID=A0ABY6BM80_9GAMM|nr:winged helix-turn-helix transcriptional regulator [Tahibacter amnicola]UXI70160.1 winged helix-turn-helix transcriptional regulator [Tahibacter amnicola]